MKDSAGEASNLVIGDACWNAMLFVWALFRLSLEKHCRGKTTNLRLESLQQSSASYGVQVMQASGPFPQWQLYTIDMAGSDQYKMSQPGVDIACESGAGVGDDVLKARTGVLLFRMARREGIWWWAGVLFILRTR